MVERCSCREVIKLMVIYFFSRTLKRSFPCFVFCWCCEVHFQPNYGEVCFSLLSFFLQVISHFIWVFERLKKIFFYHGSFTIRCLVWISLYIPCLVYMVRLPMMNCLSSALFFLNVVSLPFSFSGAPVKDYQTISFYYSQFLSSPLQFLSP